MTNIVTEWNVVLLEAIRETKPGPPMAARSIAIVHTSMYDSWAAYDPIAKQTQANFSTSAPNIEKNVETSISFAAYRALVGQYPKMKKLFDEKMEKLDLDISQTSTSTSTPIGVGNRAARNVLNFRKTDGANELGNYADTTGYVSSNKPIRPFFATTVEEIEHPDKWQPLTYLSDETRPATPGYIAAQWEMVTPFALSSANEFLPFAPSTDYITRIFRPSKTHRPASSSINADPKSHGRILGRRTKIRNATRSLDYFRILRYRKRCFAGWRICKIVSCFNQRCIRRIDCSLGSEKTLRLLPTDHGDPPPLSW